MTAPTTEGASACSRQTLRVCADIIDEFTRECLTIRIGRKLKAVDVIDTLSDLTLDKMILAEAARGNY